VAGARHKDFRVGDSAELLAEYILRKIAFVSRVPREEDVGLDLHCTLNKQEGHLLKAGPFFTVQVKANSLPIRYKKDYEIAWLSKQENPLFIGVARTADLCLDLYSTWNILNVYLLKSPNYASLIPRQPKKGQELIQYSHGDTRVKIFLGKPVVSFSLNEMMDDKVAGDRSTVLAEWVALDRTNMARRASKMYWVEGPVTYTTNDPIPLNRSIGLYSNPKNMNDSIDNFFRSSIALLKDMRSVRSNDSTFVTLRDTLSDFLQYNKNAIPDHFVRLLDKLRILS
jgi:hypothetical protein